MSESKYVDRTSQITKDLNPQLELKTMCHLNCTKHSVKILVNLTHICKDILSGYGNTVKNIF